MPLYFLISTLTPLFLPSSSVSLSYFIIAVPMREYLGKHSCMSSLFPIAILNGTSSFLSLVQEKLNMPSGHFNRHCPWSDRSNHPIRPTISYWMEVLGARPISILPVISKVYGTDFYNRLYNYFSVNNHYHHLNLVSDLVQASNTIYWNFLMIFKIVWSEESSNCNINGSQYSVWLCGS